MSDDDWDVDETVASGTSTPAPVALPKPTANKWAGEDEDDWDVSDKEEAKPAAKPKTVTAAPIKKKMTLKQKLAEKERLAAEPRDAGDDLMDERTEQDRRREARERELAADLAVASDLMGDVELDSGAALKAALTAKPTTKSDFAELSKNIIAAITSKHEANPLYAAFVEQFGKDLCENLTAVQTRKVSSALSVLGNTKQQEERDKASGKKKGGAAKPKLGGAKTITKIDVEAYDDVLSDDDFM
ncbi:Translation initiation factor 3 subunit J component [Apiotrichum porosum]|uniref:Eukaryotic translation initiation factor 3 subunit J n=1 Tax=Apiotrichum porosum TaxID=105984 RepID=A0A427XI82_9TREE|nr:Translation initiation factor 3 subunit J component [Apiotrichum porosum]RSH78591.1 Translation initiation factor 3 subunit J component [Apiotrichum porosum]